MRQKILWLQEEFEKIIKQHNTIAGALRAFDKEINYNNYQLIHKHIKIYNTDTSHWTGQSKYSGPKRNLKLFSNENMFIINSNFNYKTIRTRIIKDKLLDYKCKECSLSTWNNKNIALHLDHINGNRYDNRLENLRFLCPNCHSQTDTYCGKNINNKFKNNPAVIEQKLLKLKKLICECGNKKEELADFCIDCYLTKVKTKIEWPDNKLLLKMVIDTSLSAVGKQLQVSGNSVKKRLKKAGLYPINVT